MRYVEAFRALARHRTDEVVVTSAGHSCQAWWAATRDTKATFYLGASMSLSTMFAAGLALAQPKLNIWAFMGDGAFCMNPGTLMIEHKLNLPNLAHILVANGAYGGTLNADLPDDGRPDYAAIARAMGIARVFEFDSLEKIDAEFPSILKRNDPAYAFIVLRVEPFSGDELTLRGPPIEAAELKFLFGRHVESVTGANVFGYKL